MLMITGTPWPFDHLQVPVECCMCPQAFNQLQAGKINCSKRVCCASTKNTCCSPVNAVHWLSLLLLLILALWGIDRLASSQSPPCCLYCSLRVWDLSPMRALMVTSMNQATSNTEVRHVCDQMHGTYASNAHSLQEYCCSTCLPSHP